MIRRAWVLGPLLALAAFGLLIWDVDRPALWLDETASAVATQRSWPDLFTLLNGSDAPLVPYYVVLKLATTATAAIVPALRDSPELWFRLPSMLAAAVAAGLLAAWLAGRARLLLAVSSSVVLLLTSGFSRYGQEARPYAIVLLAAVVATIAWTRLAEDPRRRWVPLYALSVGLLLLFNLLAAGLVTAHLVLAATSPGPRRRSVLFRTALGALIGLAVVAPFLVPAVLNGRGPSQRRSLTAEHLLTAFVGLFTDTGVATGHKPLWGIGGLVIVALIGSLQVFNPRYRPIARLALAWALVPMLVLLPALLMRPNLILGRYLLFTAPGWAILAGLGGLTVVDLARRLTPGRLAAYRIGRRAGATAITAAALIGAGFSQAGSLTLVRGPGGHGEDIRPALAAAALPRYRHLPIVMNSAWGGLGVATYDRSAEPRLVGVKVQRDERAIWPVEDLTPPGQLLRQDPRIVLLLRNANVNRCRERHPAPATDYIAHCMPRSLRALGYRVETAEESGLRWTFAVLSRRGTGAAQN